jgi:hypothetical protein
MRQPTKLEANLASVCNAGSAVRCTPPENQLLNAIKTVHHAAHADSDIAKSTNHKARCPDRTIQHSVISPLNQGASVADGTGPISPNQHYVHDQRSALAVARSPSHLPAADGDCAPTTAHHERSEPS